MFELFKRAGIGAFQLFKIAYSLREELDWVRTPAGRKRLGGLLWELARAPAGEDAIDRAADELLAFISAATPSGLSDSRAGESAWWLRGIALSTPYGSWPGLLAGAARLKGDLGLYWAGWDKIGALLGREFTQLSRVSGAEGLRSLLRDLDVAQERGAAARRLERLEGIESARAALPRGQLQLLGEVGEWRVEVPHDGAAAAHAGHRSSWCTARKPDKYFRDYHKPDEGQFIYVFTNRADGSRYQATFHPGGKVEARDEADQKVDNAAAAKLYRVLQELGELPIGAEGLRDNSHALDLGPLGVRLGRPSTNSEGLPHADGAPAYRAVDPVSGGETSAWYRDGALHRDYGPAIEVNRDGSRTQVWYRDGVPWNGKGPAMVEHFGSGSGSSAAHLEADGKIGRNPQEGPAQIVYGRDGKVVSQRFMQGGRLVPPPDSNAPALDSVSEKRWVNSRGATHRAGGPAVMHTSVADPATNHEEWHKDGKLHREGGPAITGYGGMVNQYWLHGRRVRENGTPYADEMAAAVDDMRRIKPVGGHTGLESWADVIDAMEILRDEVLSGDVAGEDALDDRFMEIADMISGFIFNSVYTRRAAERIIGDFQGAGSRALG